MRLFLLFVLVGSVSVEGCGSADTSGAGGGAPSDGKVHPPPNGMPIASSDGCGQLNGAVTAKQASFPTFCGGTTPVCPGGQSLSCATFDDGTVNGCITYFRSATTCTELGTFAENCDVACKQ